MSNKSFYFLAFSMGVLLLFHGIDKIINGVSIVENMIASYIASYTAYAPPPCKPCISFGMGFMGKVFVEPSIPYRETIKYVVYLGEVVAPIFLIIGLYIRFFSAIIALYMLTTIIVIYKDVIFTVAQSGGLHIEAPFLYFLIALVLVFRKERR